MWVIWAFAGLVFVIIISYYFDLFVSSHSIYLSIYLIFTSSFFFFTIYSFIYLLIFLLLIYLHTSPPPQFTFSHQHHLHFHPTPFYHTSRLLRPQPYSQLWTLPSLPILPSPFSPVHFLSSLLPSHSLLYTIEKSMIRYVVFSTYWIHLPTLTRSVIFLLFIWFSSVQFSSIEFNSTLFNYFNGSLWVKNFSYFSHIEKKNHRHTSFINSHLNNTMFKKKLSTQMHIYPCN